MKPTGMVPVAGFCLAVTLAAVGHARPAGAERPCTHQDSLGLLPRTDPAFRDANAFQTFLTQHGFVVSCVIRSTFASFLWSAPEAAYRTNRGDVEVRFFPPPAGAERVQVQEQRTEQGWRYSFPPHAQGGDTLYAARRQYFITWRRWLILVDDPALATALRNALAR